nr:MAG TPA: hypothetical protein [Caudoviricetes sp.]
MDGINEDNRINTDKGTVLSFLNAGQDLNLLRRI